MEATAKPRFPTDWRDVKVAVLGYGVNNKALVDWLVAAKAQVTVCDQKESVRELAPKQITKKVTWQVGESAFSNLNQFQYLFRTPGLRPDHPAIVAAVDSGQTQLTSQTELFCALQPGKLIGITGTKGKGTTSSLLYHMLMAGKKDTGTNQVWLSGNIGDDPFVFLKKMTADDVVILELSSFQLFHTFIQPDIAIVLSITPDHLDYHTSWHEYLGAKSSLVRNQTARQVAILHDGAVFDTLRAQTRAKIYAYSRTRRVDRGTYIAPASNGRGETEPAVFMTGEVRPLLSAGDLNLVGEHNLENAAAAALAATLCGVSNKNIVLGAKVFTGLPHRLQKISGGPKGVTVIDDSIATTPEAGIAAIKAMLPHPIHLLAGGVSKGADYAAWAEVADQHCTSITLFGKNAPDLAKLFIRKTPTVVATLEEAVKHLMPTVQPGDVILLSPVTASFDQYPNYAARGDDLAKQISKYKTVQNG